MEHHEDAEQDGHDVIRVGAREVVVKAEKGRVVKFGSVVEHLIKRDVDRHLQDHRKAAAEGACSALSEELHLLFAQFRAVVLVLLLV